jgi:hypothetical protein
METGDEFPGPVLRIRGAAAIAAEQQLAACPQCGDHILDDAGDGGAPDRPGHPFQDGGGAEDGLADRVAQAAGPST